jgi:hypothetical protein
MLPADPTDNAATDTPDRDQQYHSPDWLLPPTRSASSMFAKHIRHNRGLQNVIPGLQE